MITGLKRSIAAVALLLLSSTVCAFLSPAQTLRFSSFLHRQTTRSVSFSSSLTHLGARQRGGNDENLQNLETQFHPEGGDWRAVRAKLIAQEQQAEQEKNPPKGGGASHHKGGNVEQVIGSLFSKAMESITKTEHHHSSEAKKEDAETKTTASGDNSSSPSVDSSKEPIFYDDLIPTVPSEELLGEDPASLLAETSSGSIGFTSPLSSQWAHELAHVEPGCVLVANEHMKHDVYQQSVILIVNHSEKEGSMGLVLCSKKKSLPAKEGENKDKPDLTIPPSFGGPLHSKEYLLLHAIPDLEGAVELCPGVYCGGQLVGSDDSTTVTPLKLFQGRAVWSSGQLQKEINSKQWYVAATCADLIWNPSWEDTLIGMGGNFRSIANKYGTTKRP